jgi:hypothetical protein
MPLVSSNDLLLSQSSDHTLHMTFTFHKTKSFWQNRHQIQQNIQILVKMPSFLFIFQKRLNCNNLYVRWPEVIFALSLSTIAKGEEVGLTYIGSYSTPQAHGTFHLLLPLDFRLLPFPPSISHFPHPAYIDFAFPRTVYFFPPCSDHKSP